MSHERELAELSQVVAKIQAALDEIREAIPGSAPYGARMPQSQHAHPQPAPRVAQPPRAQASMPLPRVPQPPRARASMPLPRVTSRKAVLYFTNEERSRFAGTCGRSLAKHPRYEVAFENNQAWMDSWGEQDREFILRCMPPKTYEHDTEKKEYDRIRKRMQVVSDLLQSDCVRSRRRASTAAFE